MCIQYTGNTVHKQPLLWNIMYNGVLRLRLPNGTTIVGFADDIAIVSVAKTVKAIEEKTNTAIRNVRASLDEAALTPS